MAHVPVVPIGRPRHSVTDAATFQSHRDALDALEASLRQRRAEVHAGWGEKYQKLVHDKGKLTARERIALLLDPGTRFLEIGLLIAYDQYNGEAPAAGVVTGLGIVHGRPVVVVALRGCNAPDSAHH